VHVSLPVNLHSFCVSFNFNKATLPAGFVSPVGHVLS
jgi:hypothetical protein